MPATPVLRELYIDRLRTVMTVLVLFHHTAITYGGSGGWFYREVEVSSAPSSLLLTLFCATNQAYFMGFFFLLAGYFTPVSLDRKGYLSFLHDRFRRLGLPLLAFIFILGPLTVAEVTASQGDRFWGTIRFLWSHQRIINGPLWFAQALLIFSLAYCLWRAIRGPRPGTSFPQVHTPTPNSLAWLLSATGVGIGAVAIRQFVPVGMNVFGLQLGYFSSYIFLFALGIAAKRNNWLAHLTWKRTRLWIVTALIVWPTLPLTLALASAHGQKASVTGGLSLSAILYAFWEPFVAWGIMAALLLIFRQRLNQPSRIWAWLDRRTYAVYILHPVVLVGISLLLMHWQAAPLVKFAATGTLTCIATWLAADPFVRLPGFRRIV